jgi:anti-anti-sigma factor
MTLLARIQEERRDGVAIATLEGEVDASNVREIGERLRGLLTNRSTTLIVDLTETTYLDSAGINLLFALASELEHRQQRLQLVVPESSHIARIVSIAGLSTVVPVDGTRQVALERAT